MMHIVYPLKEGARVKKKIILKVHKIEEEKKFGSENINQP